jgi:formate dehydrogenase assembly factor FdhD
VFILRCTGRGSYSLLQKAAKFGIILENGAKYSSGVRSGMEKIRDGMGI